MSQYQGREVAKRTDRDTKGALRASIIAAAKEGGAGSELVIKRKRYSGGKGNLEATSELMLKVQHALDGWSRYFEIAGITPAGNVIVVVLAEPPEF